MRGLKTSVALVAMSLVMIAAPLCRAQGSLFGGSAPKHIALSARLLPADARAGEGAQVVVSAKIDAPYHLYSLTQPQGGSQRTTLTLNKGSAFASVGKPVQPSYKSEFNTAFKITDQLYEDAVVFGIPVQLKPGLKGKKSGSLSVHYQLCNDKNCLIPQTVEVPFSFTVGAGVARPDHKKPVTSIPAQGGKQNSKPGADPVKAAGTANPPPNAPPGGTPQKDDTTRRIERAQAAGLPSFLALAFGAGLLALLTPCVFPMVPITVSFFAKRKQESPSQGIRDALAYCLGIIGAFTVLGVGTSVLFKATGVRDFANNPWVNIALAILFVVLGINLMGGFEITLPPALANRVQKGTQRAGILGPIFMGLTFTLTSFTCTVAFVGTLLAAAAQGSVFYPIIGMLAFSTAFALPFFLLALFPQYLARLPRSGSWLVTVKGFMGFIELAAALKFLSNADLAWDRGLLTRPVFLAVWAGLAAVAGLYLLSWLRLPHDEGTRVGWPRRTFGIASLVMSVLFLTGINGAGLGQLADFLPPSPYPGRESSGSNGPTWLHNYEAALAQAKAENRPVLVNFTGVNCTNCRDMEQNVFPRQEVASELDNFVRVELFTDRDRTDDRHNAALLQQLTGVASLPVYVVLGPDGKVRKVLQDRHSPAEFTAFLKEGRTILAAEVRG